MVLKYLGNKESLYMVCIDGFFDWYEMCLLVEQSTIIHMLVFAFVGIRDSKTKLIDMLSKAAS